MISVVTPLPLLVVHQMHGTRWWLTLEDYTFHVVVDGLGVALPVPAGYRYDRSSIPDWVGWLVSKDDLGCLAPLAHDYLYNRRGATIGRTWSRAEADEVFYQIMLADKVRPWKARLAWIAVRLFGRW